MSTQCVAAGVRRVVLTAKVIRADGSTRDLGEIGYWHKNPLRRWAHAAGRAMSRGFKWLQC